jgi:hypothetical protein
MDSRRRIRQAVSAEEGAPAHHAVTRAATFNFEVSAAHSYFGTVTVEMFRSELREALKAYEKFIVCLDNVPEDCERSLESLMEKAIKAYENRGPHLRHGIALNKHVTIILSQTENERPLCGIYFNLHSPYQKKSSAKAVKTEK